LGTTESADLGQHAAAISTAITKLHREYYGRGATTTRTVIQRNYVVVFMEDVYTPVERTLLDAGMQDSVRQTRHAFQSAMEERFTTAVETVMRRKVIAFMSQVHFDPDMSLETFVLEPGSDPAAVNGDGAPRDGQSG
jgi:uncharacterized protein YbcI